ncbi:MAG: sterol-binding protein [Gammaproteobacteria bacterium]|nr:MAG: sterol-binding protein [Gammaproteobacteria bacterium]
MANLCNFLFMPLRLLPRPLHDNGLALILNRVFSEQLADGELDFLQGRIVRIEIADVPLHYAVRLEGRRFVAASAGNRADVVLGGDLHTFLLLASQREDADTLFFQRRLRMQGDTATGLHLKNFIDAQGELALPATLRTALARFVDLYDARCATQRTVSQLTS